VVAACLPASLLHLGAAEHELVLLPSVTSLDGVVVFSHGATICGETVIMACVAGAFSIHSVVVAGANEGLVLHLLVEGKPKLPTPLDALRNSSVESSIMARHGVDALLRVEPMKAVPLVTHPGGEAQAAEVVDDELKVFEVNGFAEGKSAARQAL
jgi:hypothetical protein